MICSNNLLRLQDVHDHECEGIGSHRTDFQICQEKNSEIAEEYSGISRAKLSLELISVSATTKIIG